MKKKSKARSRDHISRLFLLADEKLQFLEKRHLETGQELSAADNERDTKTMMSLTTLFEKLMVAKDKEQAEKENVRSDEAERICVELAQRIERLQLARENKISAKLEHK